MEKQTLRDGTLASIRAVDSNDEAALSAFYLKLSADSRYFRFQGTIGDAQLKALAREHCTVTAERAGFVADANDRIIGHAMYTRLADPKLAEVAFAIADDHRGLGLGTMLLGRLADEAVQHDIDTFVASVLPENHAMIAVFRDSGFAVQTRVLSGEVQIRMPTVMTADALERFDDRDWKGAVEAVSALLNPRSVAVIGASRQRGTIGAETLHNLLRYGFTGPVYPINPTASSVQSVRAYADVQSVEGDVDLAVIVVPAKHVIDVARQCGQKGVKSLVVISAGFGETNEAGRKSQDELMDICRAYGMRLIGPNCMGILNTDEKIRMNATFAPITPTAGGLGVMSQSGALGLALMEEASNLDLGVSSFVSVGNKADLSGNDLMRYWHDDDATNVIMLYLESFGNPRKFARIAPRIARKKPIIVVKSGRYSAGARATASHTGALVAASDVPVDALLRQSGVIRTDTLGEMFDVAALLSCQKPPKGRRVAILTNAGGPAILCADACESEGLELPPLSDATREELAKILPSAASTANPVDMIASASIEQYRDAVSILMRDPGIDSIIVIFIPPLTTKASEVARAILTGVGDGYANKTVLTVFMQSHGVPAELRSEYLRLPSYRFPEDAAIALSKAVRYGEWLAQPVSHPARFPDAKNDEASAIVAAALGRGSEWLSADEVRRLLACYGVKMLEQRIVTSPEDAARAAQEMAQPVALKAMAEKLVHKSDVGAVQLNVSPADVPAVASEMMRTLSSHALGDVKFLLQPMAKPGVEMLIGVVQDPRFGPIIACGAGGTTVELLKDVSVRLAPLSPRDADEMIEGLKTLPLLQGYRGAARKDVNALKDVLLRVAQLAVDIPQISELDINPVLVHEIGVSIVDARIRVGR